MTLEQLTPAQRAAVLLFIDYYRFKEIAEKLGISEQAAARRLRHARKKFGALNNGELCRRVRLLLARVDER